MSQLTQRAHKLCSTNTHAQQWGSSRSFRPSTRQSDPAIQSLHLGVKAHNEGDLSFFCGKDQDPDLAWIIPTLMYVQLSWLWHHITLEITESNLTFQLINTMNYITQIIKTLHWPRWILNGNLQVLFQIYIYIVKITTIWYSSDSDQAGNFWTSVKECKRSLFYLLRS